jgi:hypothetical protein
MPASVLPIRVPNLRGTRDLSYSLETTGPSYAKILDDLDDRLRVNFANLEGDFPKPSSIAPDKGVIQYFYHDDAQSNFRDQRIDKFRGPYKNRPEAMPLKDLLFRKLGAKGDFKLTAPANNSWSVTIELDDRERYMQNLPEEGRFTISQPERPGWDTTEFGDGWADQYRLFGSPLEVTGKLPLRLEFTTNALRMLDSLERDDDGEIVRGQQLKTIYVPPGGTLTIEYNLQEDITSDPIPPPNEDIKYLAVNANNASWERGRPTIVTYNPVSLTYQFEDDPDGYSRKPHEDINIYKPEAKIRTVATNYDTNEDAFYYDYQGAKLFDGFIDDDIVVNDDRLPIPQYTHIGFDPRTFKIEDPNRHWYEIDQWVGKSAYYRGATETDDWETSLHSVVMRTVANANAFPYVAGAGTRTVNTWEAGQPLVKHFWSAAMVSFVLTMAERRAPRTQSALDYALYGTEVDWRSWKNVRKWDIAVFKFKNASGGHVGFIADVDLSTNKVTIVGGNQSNKFKETEYRINSVDMYLLTVRRNWPCTINEALLPGAPRS